MSPGVCSVSKTESPISSYWKFTQIEMIELTLRNVISNRTSFRDFDTVLGFMASKWVRGWSRFLISSPGWPCTQNKAQLNWRFTDCLKKRDFLQTNQNIGILYTIGNHFSSRLTIQDHYLKIRLYFARINCQNCHFCTEKCANNLGIFVVNGGHHYKEEATGNCFAPRDSGEGDRRQLYNARNAPLWVGYHGVDPHPLSVL